MTPDELVIKLESMGIHVSRRTLLRYEQNDLISKPIRGSVGRGKGRFTDYQKNTPYEFFASWYLVKKHNASVKVTAQVREISLALSNECNDSFEIHEKLAKYGELSTLIDNWLSYFFDSQNTASEMLDYKLMNNQSLDALLDVNMNTLKMVDNLLARNKQLEIENDQLKAQVKQLQSLVK